MKIKKIFFLLIILIIIVFFIGLFIWQGIYLPKDFQFKENKVFSINKGQGAFQIAENLEKEGIIKNKFFFDLYLIMTSDSDKLQAGKYSLNSTLNIPEVTRKFVLGETIKIKITIPEGFNLKQVEGELNSGLQKINLSKFSVIEFKNEFEFLRNVPSNASLEGFLFPDTYFFDPDMEGREIAKVFLENFSKKLTADLREEIKRRDKSIFEIITIASLIEKEVITIDDKKIVSGILWKRLKIDMPLQIDATISYITGKKGTNISIEETKIDSPYNTYKYKGLPIGPISNPGLESIIAAVYPKDSRFWYYLSKPDGQTVFSKTLEEHNLARIKYLQ